jgi:hypothetical protein
LNNQLFEELTDKSFTGRYDGEELIETVQTIRPALIKLYSEASMDELEDWFRRE